jgi:DNA polymerase III epsilon subunit-like protein
MHELIFLDTETTGNEIERDRLCEVCFMHGEKTETEYFKPPLPVSVKAMSITHITNTMLADKKPFIGSTMAAKLEKLLEKGIMVAHNALFDIAMLEAEGIKVPKHICTLRVARFLDPENLIPEYNLQYLRYFLDLDVEAHAHNAEDDVKVLRALFERLLKKMKEFISDEKQAIEKMIEISKQPSLFVKFNFGKYAGEPVEQVLRKDRRYMEWMLEQKLKNAANEEDWIYTLRYHLDKK